MQASAVVWAGVFALIPAFEFPSLQERPHKLALWILLALSLAHIAATWGHIIPFLMDPGRWLHEVERFAHGEVPYRDYTWQFPPVSVWLLGSIAKAFGSQVHVIWTATSVIFLLIMLAYYRYTSTLVERSLVLPAVVAGFLFSSAYAHLASTPLPTGTYMPGVPLGFLFLLTAVLLLLQLFVSGSPWHAAATGFLCGLCILTKHEFWISALYLVAVGCGVLWRKRARDAQHLAMLIVATFGLTLLGGISIIGVQAGWAVLPGIVHGFGNVAEYGGLSFPSWERITIQVTTLAILALAFCLFLLTGRTVRFVPMRKWLVFFFVVALLGCALHVYMSYHIGLRVRAHGLEPHAGLTAQYLAGSVNTDTELLNRGLRWFKRRSQWHFFPLLLPVVLGLLVALHSRRMSSQKLPNTLLFLLGLCITARLRRLFARVEWYNFLLEIPVYILAAQAFFPELKTKSQRALTLALLALVAAGLYSYWFWGVGAFTRLGALEKLETPKGSIYVFPGAPKIFRQISQVLAREDPSGQRPVFAFLYSGGYNYFLDRKNPTPLTAGFRLSNFQAEKVVADLLRLHPRPFLLDTTDKGLFSVEFSLRQWDLKILPGPYERFDRPYFDQLLRGCKTKVAEITVVKNVVHTIYDCSAQPER